MTHRLLILLPTLAVVGALLATGCARNPVTGGSDFVMMSEDQEIALGRKASADVLKQYRVYKNPSLQAYVQRVGDVQAKRSHRSDLFYRFTVLDSQQVNAFALPGGYIYITRGLLAHLNSEAELAAVLGHEIGHVTARHSVRQMSAQQAANLGYVVGSIFLPQLATAAGQSLAGLMSGALLSGYGRDHELEADRLGAEYLARAGYEPEAMIETIGVLKNQEVFEKQRAKAEDREPRVYHGVFSTHPDNDTRLQEVVRAARSLKTTADGRVGRPEFLRALDGLTYGPGPREGVVRGRSFYHQELGFALEFPDGWRIENLPDRLLAHSPDNQAVLQVSAADLNKRIPPRDFMRTRLKLPALRHGTPLDAGGLDGFTGLATVKGPFGRRPTRFSVVYLADKAYVFAGAEKSTSVRPKYDGAFVDTARSLHPLEDQERAEARGRKLHIVTVQPGMTYRRLASQSNLGTYGEQELRLLNNQFPDGEPVSGSSIKIVE